MERTQTTLRLPEELMEQLRAEAEKRGSSVNETIIRLIRKGLQGESDRAGARSPEQPAS